MSGDMIARIITMFGHDKSAEDTNNRKRRMIHELKYITKEDIDEYKTKLKYNGLDDNEIENFTKSMKTTINDFFKSMDGRETEYKWIGNETIWITGGITWGDDPTDACEIFDKFDALPHKLKMAGGFK